MAVLSVLSFSTLGDFLTWRTLAIVLALLNLKALPLAWHVRLIYHFCRNWKQRSQVKQIIALYDGPEHPIFAPVTTWSSCPLAEMDYNLHKSNGTYFTDLDIARTAIFMRTFGAGYRAGFRALEKEGKHGQLRPILGSVHTSFKKEIKPYQGYKVVSRILGWDKKWLIIASWFVLPSKHDNTTEICASCLSKYVIKKGRYTVTPEMALQVSGWLPARPTADQDLPQSAQPLHGVGDRDADVSRHRRSADAYAHRTEAQPKGILKHRASTSWSSDQPKSVVSATGMSIGAPIPRDNPCIELPKSSPSPFSPTGVDGDTSTAWQFADDRVKIKGRDWNWDRIEKERLSGVRTAQGWLDLDNVLLHEYSRFEGNRGLASPAN